MADFIEKLQIEQSKLFSLLEQKLNLLEELEDQHANSASNDKLREQILQYLKKMGANNEYVIASDLDAEPVDVYHELCFLKKEGKVEQITEDGIKWKAK